MLPGNKKKVVGRTTAKYSYIKLQLATQGNMSSNMKIDKVCAYCGGNFIAQKTSSKCCSDDCAKRFYKRRKRDEKIQSAIHEANILKPYNPVIKDKEYLSVQETCSLLGASRWTIYRLIERGSLTVAKVGRRTIIKKSNIDKLFNLTA